MGMNQIINMIMRIIMRKVINSGINAGMNKMSGGRKRGQLRQHDDHDPMLDNSGVRNAQPNTQPGMTQAEVRKIRQAKRAAKQARQGRNNPRG